MKTIRFYIDSIPKEEDYQFVNQIFDEIHADDPKIKDIILATIASGPMNAFKYMQLFYKTNHITQTKLARIVCELEIALSRKEISECKTILTKAQDIVYNRTEEQSRNYGDIQESMERASRIATHILGQDISTDIIYWSIVAIKLSREGYKHKEDNLLDAVAYMSALNDHLENNKNK
ncbi:MAG: hypothetical protein EBR30_14050 [Cytophagia bacterium]|nr:hypothetical protein [Cytophagia bacterium]